MTVVAIKTEQATGDYVRLTRVVRGDEGLWATMEVYVNRQHVTHVIGGKHVTVHLVGESSIEVAESLECVVEALER